MRQILLSIFLSMGTVGLYAQLSPLVNEKGKFGYVNDKGEFVIKAQFDEADEFFNGIHSLPMDMSGCKKAKNGGTLIQKVMC